VFGNPLASKTSVTATYRSNAGRIRLDLKDVATRIKQRAELIRAQTKLVLNATELNFQDKELQHNPLTHTQVMWVMKNLGDLTDAIIGMQRETYELIGDMDDVVKTLCEKVKEQNAFKNNLF